MYFPFQQMVHLANDKSPVKNNYNQVKRNLFLNGKINATVLRVYVIVTSTHENGFLLIYLKFTLDFVPGLLFLFPFSERPSAIFMFSNSRFIPLYFDTCQLKKILKLPYAPLVP